MTQGRCKPCRIRVVWTGRPLLRDALCPRCRDPISRTTRTLRYHLTVTKEHPFERVAK